MQDRLRWLCTVSKAPLREIDRCARKTEGHAQALISGEILEPRYGTAKAYAQVLGCTVPWLLEGEGDAPAPEAVRSALTRARLALAPEAGTPATRAA